MRNKQFAFVPQWIDSTLKRKGLGSECLLDFEKVAHHFSTEDLASLAALGLKSRIFLSHCAQNDTLSWIGHWRACCAGNVAMQRQLDDITALAYSEAFQKETLARIYARNEDSLRDNGEQKETFVVSLLGNEAVKVLIRSGFAATEHAANSSELFRSMVKQLYVYEEYHNLISRDVGKTYIASLAV